MKTARLPIGVDLGSSRIRMISARRDASGALAIEAAAVRDIPEDTIGDAAVRDADFVAAILEDLRRELGDKQRSCVLALAPMSASLRVVRIPKMTDAERRSAARFEAERFVPWDTKDVATLVRSHWVNPAENALAVGVVREDALLSRVTCAKRAGLRVCGVDHEACALQRAFPIADAVLDVGLRRSTIHAFSPNGPLSLVVPSGGNDVTRAIGHDLTIEQSAAERRKRILGTAGAGESARQTLVERVRGAVATLRDRLPVRRIALVGNGARLPGLAGDIETATEAIVELTVSDLLQSSVYPADVTRAAAPDWTLAAALTIWSAP